MAGILFLTLVATLACPRLVTRLLAALILVSAILTVGAIGDANAAGGEWVSCLVKNANPDQPGVRSLTESCPAHFKETVAACVEAGLGTEAKCTDMLIFIASQVYDDFALDGKPK